MVSFPRCAGICTTASRINDEPLERRYVRILTPALRAAWYGEGRRLSEADRVRDKCLAGLQGESTCVGDPWFDQPEATSSKSVTNRVPAFIEADDPRLSYS
jgi:hypothetical protein